MSINGYRQQNVMLLNKLDIDSAPPLEPSLMQNDKKHFMPVLH